MQFVGVSLLTAAFDPFQALLMSVMVNARHAFYGLSMLEKYRGTGPVRPVLICTLTDETFSLVSTLEPPEGVARRDFYFWISLLDYLYWQVGCTLGNAVGGLLTFDTTGLDFTLTALFIVLLLEQVKKNYASGKVTAILEASPERVEPLCPVYEACGGCQLQHLNYTGQLKAKEQQVRDALFRIGHLQEVKVLPIIGEEDPWHYRNKMQFPVAFENGILEIGCYAAATHKVVGVENCLIQKQRNNDIIAVVRQWMRQYEISAYDEKTGKGVVRHVMGRVGVNTGEVMAVIITAGYDIPHGKELVKMLRDAVPGLKSVVQNLSLIHI